MTQPRRQRAGAYGLLPASRASTHSSASRPSARLKGACCFCPQGVGVRLADDLPGTGSESRRLGCIRHTAVAGLAGASRQIASKLAPTAFGQNQEQVRIRQQAGAYGLCPESKARAASARRAWESGLPTICRAPAVNPDAWVVSDTPQLQDLLALRTRSRASLLPRPSARIKSKYAFVTRRPSARINSNDASSASRPRVITRPQTPSNLRPPAQRFA